MKKKEALSGQEYITTYSAKAIIPDGSGLNGLQKYKVKGSRKTYYLKEDVEKLVAGSKKQEQAIPSPVISVPETVVLTAYIDGSYNKETKVYGSAAIITHGDSIVTSRTSKGTKMNSIWNVAGEIAAAALAVQMAEELMPDELIIKHDYEGVAKWPLHNWQAKNEYTQKYSEYMNRPRTFKISYEHVKGHSGDRFNEMADGLAAEAAGFNRIEKAPPFAGKRSSFDEDTLRIRFQVDTTCIKSIKAFYSQGTRLFSDYASITCYGWDNLARMKNQTEFKGILTPDEMMYLSRHLQDQEAYIDALRWTVRGLAVEDALIKAQVNKMPQNVDINNANRR